MEHQDQDFDDLARALAASSTRRGTVGAVAGLLGLGLLGAEVTAGGSKQQRRRQRRRKQQRRRQDERGVQGSRRGIRLTVDNPLPNQRAVTVEFGFDTKDRGDGQCCQGQAAYTLQPSQSQGFTTGETSAYAWLDNRYFIRFFNPLIFLPSMSWTIDGTPRGISPTCCKPRGQELGLADMSEFESKLLNFDGRFVEVTRFEDEPDYKSFLIRLLSPR